MDDSNSVALRTERSELAVYTRMPIEPVRGEGCYVIDERGERYLDLYGGHAVAVTGHCHPRVVEAIIAQARRLVFYSSSVYSTLRCEASERLLRHAPHPGSRVFYASAGTEVNEVALKIARKTTGRRRVVSFEGSFHGRTLGALAASGIEKYRKTAGPVLPPEYVHIPFGDEAALDRAIDRETAAVICEPIQSLGGVRTAPDPFFRRLAERTRAAGALLIFDEVQTGLGRTGTFLFAKGVGVRPDLVTLAKGIASGIPCSAVIVAPEVARAVGPNDQGSTFGGGPIAMAALRATLDVIEEERLAENAARMGDLIVRETSGLPGVRGVRGKGLLLGIELDRPASQVVTSLLDRRVIAGATSDPHVLRLLPPLVIGAADIERFIGAFREALAATHPAGGNP